MTPLRRAQLDRLLWKVRTSTANLFGDNGLEKEEQCIRIIKACKRRLAPLWDEEARARKNALFERRYAADTAINYYGSSGGH
jgi:hypothetical protein